MNKNLLFVGMVFVVLCAGFVLANNTTGYFSITIENSTKDLEQNNHNITMTVSTTESCSNNIFLNQTFVNALTNGKASLNLSGINNTMYNKQYFACLAIDGELAGNIFPVTFNGEVQKDSLNETYLNSTSQKLVDANITDTYNRMVSMNDTMRLQLGLQLSQNNNSLFLYINSTISQHLFANNQSLYSYITTQLFNNNQTLYSYFTNQILLNNQSANSRMNDIVGNVSANAGNIQGVNQSLGSLNSTVLLVVNNLSVEISGRQGNETEIRTEIGGVNSTIRIIMQEVNVTNNITNLLNNSIYLSQNISGLQNQSIYFSENITGIKNNTIYLAENISVNKQAILDNNLSLINRMDANTTQLKNEFVSSNSSSKLQMETNITQLRNEASSANLSNNAKIDLEISSLNSSLYSNLINRTQEGSLNVNSTIYWLNASSVSNSFEIINNVFRFNWTSGNNTINDWIQKVNVTLTMTGVQSNVSIAFGNIQGINSSKANISHVHDASNLTTGVLNIGRLPYAGYLYNESNNLDVNETKLNTTVKSIVDANITGLRTYLETNITAETGARIGNDTEIRANISVLDNRTKEMTSNISSINTNLSSITTNVKNLNTSVESNSNRINGINTTQNIVERLNGSSVNLTDINLKGNVTGVVGITFGDAISWIKNSANNVIDVFTDLFKIRNNLLVEGNSTFNQSAIFGGNISSNTILSGNYNLSGIPANLTAILSGVIGNDTEIRGNITAINNRTLEMTMNSSSVINWSNEIKFNLTNKYNTTVELNQSFVSRIMGNNFFNLTHACYDYPTNSHCTYYNGTGLVMT